MDQMIIFHSEFFELVEEVLFSCSGLLVTFSKYSILSCQTGNFGDQVFDLQRRFKETDACPNFSLDDFNSSSKFKLLCGVIHNSNYWLIIL